MNSKKTLVAYFSCSGVTKKLAEDLASVMGADLHRIEPKVEYTKADLKWTDKSSRSSLEMEEPSCRPEITGMVKDIEDYDRIFLGFPIWWYTAPRIISTFLESYDMSGKTIITFATSGGSEFGDTVKDLKEVCPSAKWIEGNVLNHKSSEDVLRAWTDKF